MKIFSITLSLLILLSASIVGCKARTGCTNANSLNFDAEAVKDDGSCTFSKVVFFQRHTYINNVRIVGCKVLVNRANIGIANVPYLNGPGNCSASGTVLFQFKNGSPIDWESQISDAMGNVYVLQGSFAPQADAECLVASATGN